MRILVLTPDTNNTKPIYMPLAKDNEITVVLYDRNGYEYHNEIVKIAEATKPDWTLYLGAMTHHHNRPIPSVEVLKKIGAVAPMVHLCCDGAEPDWDEQARGYQESGAFAVQVNIDGVRTGVIGDCGLTLLYPGDPFWTKSARDTQRTISCGFAGHTFLAERRELMNDLTARGLIANRDRDQAEDSYNGFMQFIQDCRSVINYAVSGSGRRKHVKARIVEAAMSGCCVFESHDSPAAQWFTPGVDYIEYNGVEDAAKKITWANEHPQEAQVIAVSLQDKVMRNHCANVFWNQVLARAGLVKEQQPVRDIPKREWVIRP